MRRRSFQASTPRVGDGGLRRPIEVRESYELGAELPEQWASNPIVLTESAHNDWAVRRAWWNETGLLVRINRRAGVWADTGHESLYGIGTAESVAGLIKKAAPFFDIGRTTVPAGTRLVLQGMLEEDEIDVPSPFESAVAATWDWMYLDHAPEAQPGEERVQELTGRASLAAAREALAEAHPQGELSVDEPGSRWWGWRDDAGVIRAIAGASRRVKGYPWVLGSIGVSPAFRGMGLGAAVTAAISRAALQEADFVALGMYAGNEPALKTYERVGFKLLQHFESSAG